MKIIKPAAYIRERAFRGVCLGFTALTANIHKLSAYITSTSLLCGPDYTIEKPDVKFFWRI